MRPDRNLMERLAAADPLPEVERLSPEDQREADALLARLLATPVGSAAGQRRVARPLVRRRRLLVALAAGCAAVATLTAINLLEAGGPGDGGIVGKAVAAVTREDTVYHVVKRTRATGTGVDRGWNQTLYSESWHTTDGRMHEKLFAAHGTRRGRLLAEVAGRLRPGRTSGPALRYDPRENTIYSIGFGLAPDAAAVPDIDPFADPGARLRDLEQRGQLRVDGSTRFHGRRAYRLVAASTVRWRDFAFERVEFLVDSETYLPLAQRVSASVNSEPRYRMFTRYLVYESRPLDARSRAQLDLDPHPGATCAGGLRGHRTLGFPNPCPPSDEKGRSREP